MKGNPPIFIIGVGRSGTTLVQSMLNAHPEVCFPPESHFLRLYVATKKGQRIYRRSGLKGLKEELTSDAYLKRLDLNLEEVLDSLSSKEQYSDKSFYQKILSSYAEKKGKSRFGDKDPKNIEYLDHVADCFPNAVVIQVVRDPRDVIVSRMKADWSKKRGFWSHFVTYYLQTRIGLDEGKRLFGDNYHILVYEQLIEDPKRCLTDLCMQIGIKYDDRMLSFNEAAKEVITPGEMQWKKESLGPLLKHNRNKWKGILSPKQAKLTEIVDSLLNQHVDYFNSHSEQADQLSDIAKWLIKKILFASEKGYQTIRTTRRLRYR